MRRSATASEHIRALDAVLRAGVLPITNSIDAFSTLVNKARESPAIPITTEIQFNSAKSKPG